MANSEFIRRIVWSLLYWILIFLLSNIILNSLRSLLRYSASLVICDKPSNSAFIINIITVSCLLAFHVINPPNNRIIYLYEFFRFIILSVKDIFNVIFNSSPPLTLSLNIQVLRK